MTLYVELTNAGLPIISATETGEIVFQPGATLTAQQLATMNDVCMQYLRPAEYAAWAQIRDRLNNAKLIANTIPKGCSEHSERRHSPGRTDVDCFA